MERQPANKTEERISRMASALREEEMPGPPQALMAMTPRLRNRRQVRPLLAAGGLTAAFALAATLLLPRESAATMLNRILQAGDGVPRHEMAYQLMPDGTWTVTHEAFIDGTRYHSIPHGPESELFIDGNKRYDLFRKQGYALESSVRASEAKHFFYPASLKRQLGLEHVKSIRQVGQVQWRGKKVTRFDIRSEFRDGLGQLLTSEGFIYADAKTDRPYYQQFTVTGDKAGVYKDSKTGAIEWTYPADTEAKLAVAIPAGVRTFNPEKMREEVKEQVTATLGTDTVDGVKVTLRAVYVNSYGNIDVFTTGGTGRIASHFAGVRVNGKESPGAYSGLFNPHRQVDGETFFEPLDYRGLKLIYQSGRFGNNHYDFPDVFDLEVPVWKDQSPTVRSFAGYAKFRNVVPVRYEGMIFQDMQNRPVLVANGGSHLPKSSVTGGTTRN